MFQDYQIVAVRSALIPTTSYVAGTVLPSTLLVGELNQLVIVPIIVWASLTSVEIIVEFSADGTNYNQETAETIASSGLATDTPLVHTFLASDWSSTTRQPRVPVQIKDRFIRISTKGTGTLTSSTVAVNAIIGTA